MFACQRAVRATLADSENAKKMGRKSWRVLLSFGFLRKANLRQIVLGINAFFLTTQKEQFRLLATRARAVLTHALHARHVRGAGMATLVVVIEGVRASLRRYRLIAFLFTDIHCWQVLLAVVCDCFCFALVLLVQEREREE